MTVTLERVIFLLDKEKDFCYPFSLTASVKFNFAINSFIY